MQEERRMILEMLAEKKISAAEAAELLRALGVAAEPGIAAGPGPAGAPEGAGPEVPVPEGEGRSILEDFLSKLDIDWSSLPFTFGGEPYRYEEKHEGEFEPGDEPVELDFRGRNGRVEVFGWDSDGWQVLVRKKVRAPDRERAGERAAAISTFESGPKKLFFEEHASAQLGWGGSGVSIEVHVPRARSYSIQARSANGRVIVEGLRCGTLLGKTANGKVVLRDVSADLAQAKTANGSVLFEGAAGRVECQTANGVIHYTPLPCAETAADLHTANGSIRVKVPDDSDVGYRIEARTGFGGLEVNLPDFETAEYDKQFGRRHMSGATAGYADKPSKITIHARTTHGSIRVNSVSRPRDNG